MSKAEVQKFLRDPFTYVKFTCINLQTPSGAGTVIPPGGFNANQAYSPAYFDLVPWSGGLLTATTQVMLSAGTKFSSDLIAGYYVPYIAYGTIVNNGAAMVPLDNVPASNPPYKFIFTGGQNGCSLLLLKGTQAGTVCALHYPNSDGKAADYPLLARIGKTKADILLAIDFDFYGTAQNPNACSFFYHDGTEWVGVTQPQVQGAANMDWKRPSMSLNGGPKRVSSKAQGYIP